MGCLKLERNTLLRIAHTSNSERSGEDKYCAGTYKYKFQGKELQDELGLNWYDFGGRVYMPDIVRTPQLDPMAEKFYDLSPQSFLGNNPLSFIDPTGMEIINGETARRERLQSQVDGGNKYLKDNYGGNRDLTKKDFATKDEYKTYKDKVNSLEGFEKSLEKSIVNEAKIQSSIDDFKTTDPVNFNLANNLTYKDSSGNEHNIDINVVSGSEYNNGGAATRATFVKGADNSYKSIDSIETTMDFGRVKPVSSVLAHEMGHAYNIAKNPAQAAAQGRGSNGTIDCQDPSNRYSFQSQTAMDWQERYIRLKNMKTKK
jgi:RHS repeat-associated protein